MEMEPEDFASSRITTEAPEPPPAPPPELALLQGLAGTWNAEGVSLPDAPITGGMTTTDTYEWLPGGYFLVNRGQVQVAGHQAVPHLWIIGFDPDAGSYPVRAFDGHA